MRVRELVEAYYLREELSSALGRKPIYRVTSLGIAVALESGATATARLFVIVDPRQASILTRRCWQGDERRIVTGCHQGECRKKDCGREQPPERERGFIGALEIACTCLEYSTDQNAPQVFNEHTDLLGQALEMENFLSRARVYYSDVPVQASHETGSFRPTDTKIVLTGEFDFNAPVQAEPSNCLD